MFGFRAGGWDYLALTGEARVRFFGFGVGGWVRFFGFFFVWLFGAPGFSGAGVDPFDDDFGWLGELGVVAAAVFEGFEGA